MNSKITIDFHPHGRIYVDDHAFQAWFPEILRVHGYGYGPISGAAIVNRLWGRLRKHYNVQKETVRMALQQLLKQLKYHFTQGHGETRMRVSMILGHLLRQDLSNGGLRQEEGLILARHSFVVLAYLADETSSFLLAGALMQFWSEALPAIMQDHPEHRIREWQPALQKIEELDGEEMMPEFPHMPFGALDWPRGRAPRSLALAWPGHRARSAPPRRRRSPDMRLALPAYPSSGWTSPVMSPVGYPHAGYFDELGSLRYQQEEMNMKLSNVDGKLDILIHNMYA